MKSPLNSPDASNASGTSATSAQAASRASRRKQRTIQTILDAAERQFLKSGFHAATMESIASDADMAVGSLYFYFENKDSLYYAVLERALVVLETYITDALALDLPPFQKLYAVGDAYVHFAFEHEQFFRMLIFPHTILNPGDDTAATLKYNEAMKARIDLLLQLLTNLIQQAFAQGDRQPISFEHAARFLFGAWNGVLAFYLRDDTLRVERDEIKTILDEARWVLMEGIAVIMNLPDSARFEFRKSNGEGDLHPAS